MICQTWRLIFEPYARRDNAGVPYAVRQGGATKQTAKDVPPRRGWPLLGCNCVTHRLRIARDTRHSSFLASLQNQLSQIGDIIVSQPLNKMNHGTYLLFFPVYIIFQKTIVQRLFSANWHLLSYPAFAVSHRVIF